MTLFFQGKAGAPPPLVEYLLRGSFQVGDQTYANGQSLQAPEGFDVGEAVSRLADNGTNVFNRVENNAHALLEGVSNFTAFAHVQGVQRELGRALLSQFRIGATKFLNTTFAFNNDAGAGSLSSSGDPTVLLRSNNSIRIAVNGVFSNISVSNWSGETNKKYRAAIILGGCDNTGRAYNTGDVKADHIHGSLFFFKDNDVSEQWKLLQKIHVGNLSPVYAAYGGSAAVGARADTYEFVVPDALIESALEPESFHDPVVESLQLTHKKDFVLFMMVAALPSAGVVEVRLRLDWALVLNPDGSLNLVEDADGSRTTRGTLSGFTVGSVCAAYTDDSIWRVRRDTEFGMSYTNAEANKTETAGEIFALSDGDIDFIAIYPTGTEGEYSYLDDYLKITPVT